MVMDKTKYHLGYKFKDVEIFPIQDNKHDGTHLVKDSILIAMEKAGLQGALPGAMIIYRPNMSTHFISLLETKAFKQSNLPVLIVRNNKGESSTFTSKNLEYESTETRD